MGWQERKSREGQPLTDRGMAAEMRRAAASLRFRLSEYMVQLGLPAGESFLSCRHGFELLFTNPRKSVIARSIFLTGVWEPKVTDFARSWIRPGMVVVDVGAHVGYYTLLFAQLVGEDGHVFAFEPIPAVNRCLEQSIRLNGFTNVTMFSTALFDVDGNSPIGRKGKLLQPDAASTKDPIIETKVFDHRREEWGIGPVDLVKIDVEGAEMNVLLGMEKCLSDSKPGLLIEVHPQGIWDFGYSPSILLEFLSERGYRAQAVDGDTIDFARGNAVIFCEPGN